uniref:Uncharacterized protein n=1 Tax=Macrostomum lignano TaxID=282301 RepID=A0A1I8I3B3_9PLAT
MRSRGLLSRTIATQPVGQLRTAAAAAEAASGKTSGTRGRIRRRTSSRRYDAESAVVAGPSAEILLPAGRLAGRGRRLGPAGARRRAAQRRAAHAAPEHLRPAALLCGRGAPRLAAVLPADAPGRSAALLAAAGCLWQHPAGHQRADQRDPHGDHQPRAGRTGSLPQGLRVGHQADLPHPTDAVGSTGRWKILAETSAAGRLW